MKRAHRWVWAEGYRWAMCEACHSRIEIGRDDAGRSAITFTNSIGLEAPVRHVGEMPGCRGRVRG